MVPPVHNDNNDTGSTVTEFSPVLALQGSPRRNGNTNALLDETLDTVSASGVSVEKVCLRDLKISPCLEIYQCMKTGQCAIRDDMVGLYQKMKAARVVILSTPVFFYGPSATAKAAIDRCQALWARKYILKEKPEGPRGKGYLIAAGATRGRKLFDGLLLTARYFFDCLEMDLAGQILVRGVDGPGEVRDKKEAMDQARELGREIASFAADGNRAPETP